MGDLICHAIDMVKSMSRDAFYKPTPAAGSSTEARRAAAVAREGRVLVGGAARHQRCWCLRSVLGRVAPKIALSAWCDGKG